MTFYLNPIKNSYFPSSDSKLLSLSNNPHLRSHLKSKINRGQLILDSASKFRSMKSLFLSIFWWMQLNERIVSSLLTRPGFFAAGLISSRSFWDVGVAFKVHQQQRQQNLKPKKHERYKIGRHVNRPSNGGNTISHSNTEVKQHWAWKVLGWATAWELQVLLTKTKAGRPCGRMQA